MPPPHFLIWIQIAVLEVIVNAMFSMTDAILIETSHTVAARLRGSKRFIRGLQRLGGGVLIALGVNLALARNQSCRRIFVLSISQTVGLSIRGGI